jgi:hypothetical protein
MSRRVSERVAALTFAHEIGHSLGATHDPPECEEEDGEAGQYLMYRYCSYWAKSGSTYCRENAGESVSFSLAKDVLVSF